MPSLGDLESWMEEQLPQNLHDLPQKVAVTVNEYYELLFEQLTKYGPPAIPLPSFSSLPEITKSFSEPAVPPPPPPSLIERLTTWLHQRKRMVQITAGVLVLGLGTTVVYRRGLLWIPGLGKRPRRVAARRAIQSKNGLRKEAVVVLGADTPLGRSLVLHLSSLGMIVLASVSSSAALSSFEALIPPSSRGYVKAIMLDTSDPTTSLPDFARALHAALSLRFPLTSAGDPYARPGDSVSVAGVVNVLSYVPSTLSGGVTTTSATSSVHSSMRSENEAPSAMVELSPTTLAEALDRHVTASLCALGALLPLLRSTSNRSPASEDLDAATILTLVSAPASRTALPGEGVRSIVSQATVAGIDAIRRECEGDNLRVRQTRRQGAARRRTVRISTLEVHSNLSWLGMESGSGETLRGRQSTSSRRPDENTRAVLERLTDLLLAPSSWALKGRYSIGHSVSSYVYRLLTHLPASWLDTAFALRSQLSLRRSGLIGGGGAQDSNAGGPAGRTTPRASMSSGNNRSSSYPLRGSHPQPHSHFDGPGACDAEVDSQPDSERSSSGLPSSVPSSAYDSSPNTRSPIADHSPLPSDVEEGPRLMRHGDVSTPSASASASRNFGFGVSSSTSASESATSHHGSSSGDGGGGVRGREEGDRAGPPWMGPASGSSPPPFGPNPAVSAGGSVSSLGHSWVALGDDDEGVDGERGGRRE